MATGGCEHGTAVASMVISHGASDCEQCRPDDAAKKGVAPGLDSVLDADTADLNFDEYDWALGVDRPRYPGAADPAEALNYSAGSPAVQDDNARLRGIDNLISTFGVNLSTPAGNVSDPANLGGPTKQQLDEPCIAYDTLCVGSFENNATVERSDDRMSDFSSRGPTPGGRKKPDLVAIGNSEVAEQRWSRPGYGLWSVRGEGTSLSAPQVGGAAALLTGAGISDPLAQRAILINSAHQGRATPSSPMGSQAGWQPDWGWGALDLEAAVGQLTNIASGDVPGGSARFFSTDGSATGDRTTLVWNRRAVGCLAPGCSSTGLTLTDLDLQALDPTDGAIRTESASRIDNVEQVHAPGASPGPTVFKVKARTGVDGLEAEPFALASTRALRPLATPRPKVTLDPATAQARQGGPVALTATVENPSGDLAAERPQVTLELPEGVALAPGSAPAVQALDTLAPAGQPGAKATVTWSVIGTVDGAKDIVVRALASRYGEDFESSATGSLLVDSTPPMPTLNAPPPATTGTALSISWSATDTGVGVAGYELDSARTGKAFSSELPSTSATSTTATGIRGQCYRFRLRATDVLGNVSPYVASPGSTFVAPKRIRGRRPDAGLRLRKATVRGGLLTLRASASCGARLPMRVSYRSRSLDRKIRLRHGRRTAVFRLPAPLRRAARGTVTIRYPGYRTASGKHSEALTALYD